MNKRTQNFIRDFDKLLEKYDMDIDTDNTGQILLYTGLMFDENNNVVPWQDPDDVDANNE